MNDDNEQPPTTLELISFIVSCIGLLISIITFIAVVLE